MYLGSPYKLETKNKITVENEKKKILQKDRLFVLYDMIKIGNKVEPLSLKIHKAVLVHENSTK